MTTNVFVAGQSYATQLMRSKDAFVAGLPPGSMVGSHAVGGSSAERTHAHPNFPDRWWWDTETGSHGPVLLDAIAKLQTLRGQGHKFECILWMQGEADSVWSPSDADNPDELAKYYSATRNIMWQLAVAAHPVPVSTTVMMLHIGRRLSPGPVPGVEAIRETQHDLLASSPRLFAMPAIYDLPLRGEREGTHDSHPPQDLFDETFAGRVARGVRRLYGDTSVPVIPTLQSIYALSETKLRLTFESDSPLSDDVPTHLNLQADGVDRSDFALTWESDRTLMIDAPASLVGEVVVRYPFGQLDDFDVTRTIRDATDCPVSPFRMSIDVHPESYYQIFVTERYGSIHRAIEACCQTQGVNQ